MSLKILTFNIHKGFNWNNTQLTLHYLKENLREQNPDIIFLQEVVGEDKKNAKKFDKWIDNQFEFLAQDLWDSFEYSNHAVFDHRHHGNVILSKFPITKSEVINISQNKFEQRGVLFCEIDLGDQIIHAYCVHLNLLHKQRVNQYKSIQKILKRISDKNKHIIIAGDFNDWSLKATSHLFDKGKMHDAYKSVHHEYAKTFPSILPVMKLDRIYTKGMNISKAEVLKNNWDKLSDHLPIYIEAELT